MGDRVNKFRLSLFLVAMFRELALAVSERPGFDGRDSFAVGRLALL